MSDRSERRGRGIRPQWMFRAAREAQLLAGSVAGSGLLTGVDVGKSLRRAIPPTANELERYVLEGLIARGQQEMEARSRPSSEPVDTQDLATRAARLLDERYAEPWTIPRLAHVLGTNRCDLTTQFKAKFRVGVHQYLVRCRVDAVENRIRGGEKVEAAAHDVGFRSKKTLYDAVMRVRGVSLKVWRRGGE